MNRNLLIKIIGICLLVMLMSIAVSFINSIILERQNRQSDVIASISKSSATQQTILGPVLAIPYTQIYNETISENGIPKVVKYSLEDTAYILPEQLAVQGNFATQFKFLGIYKALLYTLGSKVEGRFTIPKNLAVTELKPGAVVTWHEAYLSIGIADPRGIGSNPHLQWNGNRYAFSQGTKSNTLGKGMHADIGKINPVEMDGDSQTVDFSFELDLKGMESFNVVPVANINQVKLSSKWPHPHFNGSFLPESDTQKINAEGFTARWEISSLASNMQETLLAHLKTNTNCNTTCFDALSVSFVEPINIYSQADRATKYGLLFIGLTFAGFFLFEILKNLPIHPAQYTMVGLAMAMFYLLLVSLSEHIGFGLAYLVASAACVGLLGYYLSHILHSKARGMGFSIMLTALYGALYGILSSEDNALMMGSLLVFGLLALSMIATRKVDWYQINLPNKLSDK